MREAAKLHVLRGGDLVELPHFHAVGKNQLDAPLRAGGGLAAQAVHRGQEIAIVRAAGFDLQEAQIGAALLFEVAERRHVAVFQNQDLVAALFHIAQQVRGKDQAQVAAVADLLNQLDHARARGRVEAVGGLVQEEQLGAVRDGGSELRRLLHAQRIRAERPVSHFAKADIKERFMGALKRRFARQTRKLSHQAHEAHAGHRRDEGIVFRHVADERAHFARVACGYRAPARARFPRTACGTRAAY